MDVHASLHGYTEHLIRILLCLSTSLCPRVEHVAVYVVSILYNTRHLTRQQPAIIQCAITVSLSRRAISAPLLYLHPLSLSPAYPSKHPVSLINKIIATIYTVL